MPIEHEPTDGAQSENDFVLGLTPGGEGARDIDTTKIFGTDQSIDASQVELHCSKDCVQQTQVSGLASIPDVRKRILQSNLAELECVKEALEKTDETGCKDGHDFASKLFASVTSSPEVGTRLADSLLHDLRTRLAFDNKALLLGKLGEGAFGSVHRIWRLNAKSPQERLAVVKLSKIPLEEESPLGEKTAEHKNLQRFQREIMLIRKLGESGAVPAFYESGTLGTDTKSYPYYTMEYQPGWSLESIVKAVEMNESDAIGSGVVAELLIAQLRIVMQFRDMGITHRDLKPANFRLLQSGALQALDLGLATGEAAHGTTQTEEFDTGGTFAYAAPEQLLHSLHNVTSAADLYPLGVIAYQMLAKRLPVEGSKAMDFVQKHHQGVKPDLSRIAHPVLRKVIGQLLEKEPLMRGTPEEHIEHLAEAGLTRWSKRTALQADIPQLRIRLPENVNATKSVLETDYTADELQKEFVKLYPEIRIASARTLTRRQLLTVLGTGIGAVAVAGISGVAWNLSGEKKKEEKNSANVSSEGDSRQKNEVRIPEANEETDDRMYFLQMTNTSMKGEKHVPEKYKDLFTEIDVSKVIESKHVAMLENNGEPRGMIFEANSTIVRLGVNFYVDSSNLQKQLRMIVFNFDASELEQLKQKGLLQYEGVQPHSAMVFAFRVNGDYLLWLPDDTYLLMKDGESSLIRSDAELCALPEARAILDRIVHLKLRGLAATMALPQESVETGITEAQKAVDPLRERLRRACEL